MSQFQKSKWAKAETAQAYVDHADIFIPERRRLYGVVKSYFEAFCTAGAVRALDLGCGDGALSRAIGGEDGRVSWVLLDGSESMLGKAQENFAGRVQVVHVSFQELISRQPDLGGFDFICSALAIHHLTWREKSVLFKYCHQALNPGGCLAVVDVVLAPAGGLEHWYLQRWRKWIEEKALAAGRENVFGNIPDTYKQGPENTPDTLAVQLAAMEEAGFAEVDVFYKQGIFSVFGGYKPKAGISRDEADAFPLGAYDPGL
ncbi:class I SAM-dependent methyltransferase [candidate division FCPU426 bacterium]|nr:class I SAM-dependent methyltransferase [candidate division FCPU426 bacterium]